jgi:hypothetical protein
MDGIFSMKTNLNICVATGLTVAFFLTGCGSTGTPDAPEIIVPQPNGFPLPTNIQPPIDRSKAASGNPEAQFNLGLQHDIAGQLVTAAEWYQKAADTGLAEAQFNLALMLEKGTGVKMDIPLAAMYYVPKDDAEAAKWFLRAAENLHMDAQYYTGLCYAHGDGVEQDLVQAYKWLNLAAAANHRQAQRDKEVLTDQMIPEAVAEGQRLSVEFQAAQ